MGAEFETVVAEFTRALQPAEQPAKGGGRSKSKQGRQRNNNDAAAAKRLQWLYRKNRPKAMREVRQEESPLCTTVSPEEAATPCLTVFSPKPPKLQRPYDTEVLNNYRVSK